MNLGIIGRLDEIADESARFYAFIGLCVSTASSIERSMFDCYFRSSGQTRSDAVAVFYRDVRFQRKREITDAAVRNRLQSPSAVARWSALHADVERCCGPNGGRNLVSHNPLAMHIYVGANDDGVPMQGSDFSAEIAVMQNSDLVAAGDRPADKHTLMTLRLYAGDLLGLDSQLIEFRRYLAEAFPPPA